MLVHHLGLGVCVFLVLITGSQSQTITNVKDLITKLFSTDSYNSKVRPITDQSRVIQVGCDFVLTSIIDFNEQDESLKTSGYLELYWTDDNLVWTPSDYGGIQTLFLPQNEIWRPDISLRNNFKTNTGLGSTYLNLAVVSDGSVFWQPFQVMESTCDMDITYFPFDTQTCELKFIAWSYTKAEVELNKGKNGIYLEQFSPNSLWNLIETSATEVNTAEAAVVFTMVLKRKPIFYIINIITPVIMLSFLNVMTFSLPVKSGERASYTITVFLSMAVFLTIVAAELPKNSDVVSLMSVYVVLMSFLSTIIVCITLFELRIAARTAKDRPVGKGYRLIHVVSMRLRCQRVSTSNTAKVIPEDDTSYQQNKTDLPQEEDDDLNWVNVIDSLDFLLWWTFFIITFIITTVLAVLCINKS